jgi:hypothetical protein
MKRACFVIAAAAVLLSSLPREARTWGEEGHSIVAEIAQRRLTPEARAKVREILGGDVSLGSIASWPDDVRDLIGKSYNWHFVDIPLSATDYDPARDCQDSPRGDCIINAIERNRRTLSDPLASAKDRAEALKFIVHFVGDIHQPLHTVKDFVGGNLFPVTYFVDPLKRKKEPTNLHAVWDVGLIRSMVWDWGAYVSRLEDEWLPGKDLSALAGGTPVDWALEAHKAAIEVAFTVQPNADLGDAYLALTRPIVDRQLALAGIRLARTLNGILVAPVVPPQHIVEQYKAYIGDLDSVGMRYSMTQTFYLTIVAALIAVLSFKDSDRRLRNYVSPASILVFLFIAVVCYVWYETLEFYKVLFLAKFDTLRKMEDMGLHPIYKLEHDFLGNRGLIKTEAKGVAIIGIAAFIFAVGGVAYQLRIRLRPRAAPSPPSAAESDG